MRVFHKISSISREIRHLKKKNKLIGFVPTMGYLHEGHLSLMRKARKGTDVVVVSIYVNPTQFGPKEDYRIYPRDLKRDLKLCKSVGVDIVFNPNDREMYSEGYATYVNLERLTDKLCGASRPRHFRGVATIVTKLFNIVQPDIAYFGQKDAQQALIIQRMARDLNFPIKIKAMSIVREEDGLAMSSRNTYLYPRDREEATLLYKALCKAKELIGSGEKKSRMLKSAMRGIIEKAKDAKIDYISIVDLKDLNDVGKINDKALIALAVWIGKTRLIDNMIVSGGKDATYSL